MQTPVPQPVLKGALVVGSPDHWRDHLYRWRGKTSGLEMLLRTIAEQHCSAESALAESSRGPLAAGVEPGSNDANAKRRNPR